MSVYSPTTGHLKRIRNPLGIPCAPGASELGQKLKREVIEKGAPVLPGSTPSTSRNSPKLLSGNSHHTRSDHVRTVISPGRQREGMLLGAVY